MNTIAAKQLRSEMVRCRPPYGGRGGVGSNGSTSAHALAKRLYVCIVYCWNV
jgi:hypothetical protein